MSQSLNNLKRTNRLMKEIQRVSRVGAWEYDVESGKMFWTDEVYSIYGVPKSFDPNDINRNVDFYAPPERVKISSAFQNALEKGASYDLELQMVNARGKKIWVRTIGKAEKKKGRIIRVFGNIMDTTQKKEAEQKLQDSYDMMRYIVEHDTSAIAIHDRDLNYIYVSKGYLQDYRVKEKNIIGKHHYEVFPDIPAKWREVHQRALAGEVSGCDEDPFERQDGSVDWTRWECRPWYDAKGSVGGIVVYTEVINERKRKEIEINELNRRLELLTDSVKELASARSLEDIQKVVTSSVRQLVNADGATMIFKENDHCYYAAEDAISPLWQGKRFPMSESIGGWVMLKSEPAIIGDIYQDERIPKDLYRSTFVKSLAMVPLITDEPLGAIGSYWKSNYTPTKIEIRLLQTLADAAARSVENVNLHAELEARVKERTAQLASLNNELRTFTYSVSHDLKAPLRGIDGYSKLLFDNYGNSLDEEARFFIKTIRSSTTQMNQLIDDLLEYSRLERSHSSREKINLRKLFDSVLSVYREELESKGFTLKTRIPDDEIISDPMGLTLVLRNLIDNAIKFSAPKPDPAITITAEKNESSWVLCVGDNGIGFDIKFQGKIFEIFQRLQRTEDYPGTGIGLAMVKKAMNKMGGKVRAESEPGSGSAFYIEIPL